tara:strand:- start:372 stop:509 length:138 start_codon:yes stop_codon:yes gene_type:complete
MQSMRTKEERDGCHPVEGGAEWYCAAQTRAKTLLQKNQAKEDINI